MTSQGQVQDKINQAKQGNEAKKAKDDKAKKEK